MVVRRNYRANVVRRQKPPKLPKRPRTKKELTEAFARVGRGALVALAAFCFVLFVYWGANLVRTWVEGVLESRFISSFEQAQPPAPSSPLSASPAPRQGNVLRPPAPSASPQPYFRILPPGAYRDTERLIPASFTDLFSGVAWLNQSATTLTADRRVTSLTFEPRVTWEKAPAANANDFTMQGSDGSVTECLGSTGRPHVGSACLTVQGASLSLNGRTLALPAEMQGKTVESVSIGALATRFAVGVVTDKGGEYEGWVYLYDGNSFRKVFDDANTPFLSSYKGTLGFGGTDDDWLAIYGAYESKAVEVHADYSLPTTHYFFTNISSFMGIRVMDGGFAPAVTRVAANGGVFWYVWSLTPGRPRLVKLYSDPSSLSTSSGQAGAIAGAFDFTPRIFGDGSVSRASFRAAGAQGLAPSAVEGSAIALQAETVSASGAITTYIFSDGGYAAPAPATVQSVNINNYPAEVRSATIVDDILFTGDAGVQFYLSNNGTDWVRASVGREIVFPSPNGRQLLWRAEFTPAPSSATFPPFFGRIRVDYKVKFL